MQKSNDSLTKYEQIDLYIERNLDNLYRVKQKEGETMMSYMKNKQKFARDLSDTMCKRVRRSETKKRYNSMTKIRQQSDPKRDYGEKNIEINKEISNILQKMSGNAFSLRINELVTRLKNMQRETLKEVLDECFNDDIND